jgi:hypothetical protein
LGAVYIFVGVAHGHDVSASDRALLAEKSGFQFLLYGWLGAKHMITGYDHLLFLLGVIFYLNKLKDVAVLVSLFAIGHTITLLSAVLLQLNVNVYIVDAIIGLSVAYKGFDNLGGFKRLFGETPDERTAIFVFGLFHGLGLGSKLQDLGLKEDGLIVNLLAFNIGVEAGQFAALIIMFLMLRFLAPIKGSRIFRLALNTGLIFIGLALMVLQLAKMVTSG